MISSRALRLSLAKSIFFIFLISRECDPDLLTPTKSLLYAAGRIEAPELDRVLEQLQLKYGKAFVDVSSDAGKALVDPRLIVKLSMRSPDIQMANRYMAAIAEAFNVDWAPAESPLLMGSTPPSPYPMSPTPTQAPVYAPACPAQVNSRTPSVSSTESDYSHLAPPPYKPLDVNLPSSPSEPPQFPIAVISPPIVPGASPSPSSSGIPDFDELTRRFQALKDASRRQS